MKKGSSRTHESGISGSLVGRAITRCRSSWWLARLKLDALRCGGRLQIGKRARLRTRVVFRGRGTLRIGEDSVLGDAGAGQPGVAIYLSPRGVGAWIGIGAGSRLANGVEMIALERIETGERTLIGAGTRILDSDFHGVGRDERGTEGRSSWVRIGDDAWLGMSAVVLKGVTIGEGAMIGAGSVVSRDVAAGSVVAGNPARLLAVYAGA